MLQQVGVLYPRSLYSYLMMQLLFVLWYAYYFQCQIFQKTYFENGFYQNGVKILTFLVMAFVVVMGWTAWETSHLPIGENMNIDGEFSDKKETWLNTGPNHLSFIIWPSS